MFLYSYNIFLISDNQPIIFLSFWFSHEWKSDRYLMLCTGFDWVRDVGLQKPVWGNCKFIRGLLRKPEQGQIHLFARLYPIGKWPGFQAVRSGYNNNYRSQKWCYAGQQSRDAAGATIPDIILIGFHKEEEFWPMPTSLNCLASGIHLPNNVRMELLWGWLRRCMWMRK